MTPGGCCETNADPSWQSRVVFLTGRTAEDIPAVTCRHQVASSPFFASQSDPGLPAPTPGDGFPKRNHDQEGFPPDRESLQVFPPVDRFASRSLRPLPGVPLLSRGFPSLRQMPKGDFRQRVHFICMAEEGYPTVRAVRTSPSQTGQPCRFCSSGSRARHRSPVQRQ